MPCYHEPGHPTIEIRLNLTQSEIEAVAKALSNFCDDGPPLSGQQSDSLHWSRIKFSEAALDAFMAEAERSRPAEELRHRPAPPSRRPPPPGRRSDEEPL